MSVGFRARSTSQELWGCRRSPHMHPPPFTPSLGEDRGMGPVVRAAEPLSKDTRGATDSYRWSLGVSGRCLWLPQVSEKLRAGERAPGSP